MTSSAWLASRGAAGDGRPATRGVAVLLAAIVSAALLSARPVGAQGYVGRPSEPPSVTLPAELQRVLRDYEQGWRAGDAERVAGLFTEDGMALPNGRPAAPGRAAIARAYAGPGGDLRLRALQFAVADSVGWIIGAYRYGDGEGDAGKFVLALRRRGSAWSIAADIDNANAPPAPVASPRPTDGPPVAGTMQTERRLVQLTEARVAADFAADRVALDSLLAPELRYARSSGVVDDKAGVLAQVGPTGPYALDALTPDSLRAQAFGATGVVTGILLIKLKAQSAPYRVRFTDVWVERDGRWRLVAFQATRLPS